MSMCCVCPFSKLELKLISLCHFGPSFDPRKFVVIDYCSCLDRLRHISIGVGFLVAVAAPVVLKTVPSSLLHFLLIAGAHLQQVEAPPPFSLPEAAGGIEGENEMADTVDGKGHRGG